MSYQEPQVKVYQTFEASANITSQPLHATIIGPRYDLYKIDITDLDSTLALGEYDWLNNATYSWPFGSNIDLSYAKLYIVNGHLLYFTDLIGSGSTIVAGTNNNEITASSLYFVNKSGYSRSAGIPDDVQVGDYALIDDGAGNTQFSQVTGFGYEAVAATVGSSTPDAGNNTDQSASSSISYTGAVSENGVTAIEDSAAYDGYADGYINETYVVEVTSTDGTPVNTIMSVTSASGTDDDSNLVPSAFGSATNVGTRGLTVTFDLSGTTTPGGSYGFVVGQKWTVVVAQAYNEPTTTANSTFTGTFDTTYIVTVTKGGKFADSPEVSITSTTGVDSSGPVTVSGYGTAITAGHYGVTITFTQGTTTLASEGLVKGDKWTIAVTAAGEGGADTLKLADNLSTALASASDLKLQLFRLVTGEISQYQTGCIANWSAAETGITVNSGIKMYATIGSYQEWSLYKGTLYIHYRALNVSDTGLVTVDSPTSTVLGTIDPDNPIAYAAYLARSTSGEVDVYAKTVSSDDAAGYTQALEELTTIRKTYGLVPCSQDETIINLVRSHVLTQSVPGINHFRCCWVSRQLQEKTLVVDENNSGSTLLATITSSGSSSTVTGVDVDFIAAGVAVGDELRYNYSAGCGDTTYSGASVTEVVSSTELKIGVGVDVSPASKIEVWHPVTKSEAATQIRGYSEALTNRRVKNIWPDMIDLETYSDQPGYFQCAILAGTRAGTYPHQGLTNYPVPFVSKDSPRFEYFNTRDLLNTVAGGGTWIVTVDEDGNVITRHQLTTGYVESNPDSNESEDTVTANLDYITFQLLDVIVIGTANTSDSYLEQLQHDADDVLRVDMKNTPNAFIGPQLVSGTITSLERSDYDQNTLIMNCTLDLPDAVNEVDLTLQVTSS